MGFDVGSIFGDIKLETAGFKKSVATINKGQTEMTKKAGGASSAFKGLWKQMAAGLGVGMLVASAVRAIRKQITDTIQKGREFEKQWANVTTMLSVSEKETAKLRQGLINLSPTLGSTINLAKGMYQVLSASIEPAKAIRFLGVAAKAAQAGITDVYTSVDALTTVINAYGMAAEDVTKVSDIMFATVKRGKLTYGELAGALGTVIPVAATVGIEFEDVAAALASLTRQGINVQTATMQLRQVFMAVLKPGRDAIELAEDLGLEFSVAALQSKGLAGFLEDVKIKTGGSSEAISILFKNVRAMTPVMALTGRAAKGLAKDILLMKSASGLTEEAFQKQMKTADFWITTVGNTIEKMKIQFYEGLVDSFRKGIKYTRDLEDRIKLLTLRSRQAGEEFAKVAGYAKHFFGVLSKGIAPGIAKWMTDYAFAIDGIKTFQEGATEATLKGMRISEQMGMAYDMVKGKAKKFKEELWSLVDYLNKCAIASDKTGLRAAKLMLAFKDLGIKTKFQLNAELDVLLERFNLIRSSGKATDSTIKALAEEAVKLANDVGRKLDPSIIKLTKSTIDAAYASDKLKLSLADLHKLTVDIPPKIKDWGKTSKTVGDVVGGSLGKIIDTTGKTGDEFDFLSASWYASGKEIQTTSEKVAAGLIKTGKDIGVTWEDVAKNMTDYWSNAMAQMVQEGINLSDILNIGWQTMAVGAGSAVSKVISEIGSLGALAGPLGALAGSVAGAAISAIGSILGVKSAAQKAAEEEAKALEKLKHQLAVITSDMSIFGEITKSTAEKITESRNSMEGYLAVSKHFGEIIADVGVTQENVNDLWARATDIIHHFTEGELSATDATNALDESFNLLLAGVQKLGEEGSAAMIEFIQKVRESGLEIASVTEYVIDQLDRIPAALETLIASQEKTGQSMESLESKTLAAFSAMQASGMSWSDIIQKISPSLNALKERMKEMGHTGSAAIKKLFKIAEVTEKNKELFDAIEADREILEALGNTGFMTADLLKDFSKDAIKNFKKLEVEFGNSDDALRAMGPTLQQIKDYAEAYNITLDEGTQKLIDQGIELGVVKEKQESVQEVAERGFAEMKDVLTEIRDLLRGMGDELKGSGIYQKLKDVNTVSKITWTNMNAGLSSVIDKVGGLSSEFGDTFTDAEIAARATAQNIHDVIGKLSPVVDIKFDYDVPKFEYKGKVKFEYEPPEGGGKKGGKYAGKFQHGGVIEAGPRQPTLFMFGEGSRREVAEIRHEGGGGGEVGGKREVHIHGPLIQTTGISRSDLERVGEELRRIVEYQLERG